MCNNKDEQPEIQYAKSPEYDMQMGLFNKYTTPWMEDQWKQYTDVYSPLNRSLGGVLGDELKNPTGLSQETYDQIWGKAREKRSLENEREKQAMGERFAGGGMLGQPVAEKGFQGLAQNYAKSIEDMSVDFAVRQAMDQITARQQSISNASAYMGGQPTFSMRMPSSTPYLTGGSGGDTDYSGLGGLAGMGALGLASLLVPGSGIGLAGLTGAQMAGLGGAAGAGLGSIF